MVDAHGRSLEEIAALVGGKVVVSRPVVIRGTAGVETAGPADVTFYENPKFLPLLRAARPGAVLVSAVIPEIDAAQIQVEGRPYLKFIDLVLALHPPVPPPAGVHATAVVAADAVLGPQVAVGPLAVVESGARIGARSIVGALAHVGAAVEIGEDCCLFPRAVVLSHSRLGNRVLVHCGAVIGDDGFGYVRDGDRHVKIPHTGRVVIEDDVEVGANTTVDRATFGETVIGAGTKIDNLVMIAHNVRLGRRCILAAQVGIAGSSIVGDDSILAGQVGVASGARVGNRVVAAAKSGLSGTVPDDSTVAGIPARDHRTWTRAVGVFWRLPDLLARLRAVERGIGVARPAGGSGSGGAPPPGRRR